jgi:DNA-binding XRE family transcriptional regulator
MMKKTLGQALKSARQALGLMQRQLASQIGVQSEPCGFLESDRQQPSLGLLSRLAEVLMLKRDKLFLLARPEASFPIRGQAASRAAWPGLA